jgi:hypothetical protein
MGEVKSCAAGKAVEVKRQYTGGCVKYSNFNPSYENREKVSHTNICPGLNGFSV